MTYGGMLEFKLSVIEKAATESRIALRDAYPFGGYAFTSMVGTAKVLVAKGDW
jgi:hypothetical protein